MNRKVILELDLNDDADCCFFTSALSATLLRACLDDVDVELRSLLKYQSDGIPDEIYAKLENLRERCLEELGALRTVELMLGAE